MIITQLPVVTKLPIQLWEISCATTSTALLSPKQKNGNKKPLVFFPSPLHNNIRSHLRSLRKVKYITGYNSRGNKRQTRILHSPRIRQKIVTKKEKIVVYGLGGASIALSRRAFNDTIKKITSIPPYGKDGGKTNKS